MVTEFLKETVREVRYALRALMRYRSFTVAAVLSLALEIREQAVQPMLSPSSSGGR